MSFFRRKERQPAEVLRAIRDNLLSEDGGPQANPGVSARLDRSLAVLKEMLYGDEAAPDTDLYTELVHQALQTDVVYLLISDMASLSFEGRHDAVQCISSLVRRCKDETRSRRSLTEDYILNTHPDTLALLVRGYGVPDIGLACGQLIREFMRHKAILEAFLGAVRWMVYI
ncbi:conidiophore development protein HymA [Kipferlia bialata]|uniref:Conidiophore development protein HymA n=1 Tax=Kipferlia bialata TaxID=797122 RepID=A0A9K3GIX6_9EUKA|nr:conidiophore development protein HymA [Kipferlia bialata]|eukprot:g5453.t1